MLSLEFKNWLESSFVPQNFTPKESARWRKDGEYIRQFEDKPLKVSIWVNQGDRQIDAKIKNKVVGRMILWRQKQEVYKVAVDEPFKKLGIGTLMYQTAEKNFGEISPSSVLSDDAFAFWNKYRPGAIPQDNLRHYASQLIGKLINHPKFGPCEIQSLGSNSATCRILQGEKQGMTTSIDKDMILNQINFL